MFTHSVFVIDLVIDEVVEDTLVEAFVMSAEQDEMGAGPGVFGGELLVEAPAGG